MMAHGEDYVGFTCEITSQLLQVWYDMRQLEAAVRECSAHDTMPEVSIQ